MPNTKKLLSITKLKKYFPIAKASIFQREQLYVRANEEVTLDIFSGETVGLVGESGCGKSTLGRTILQLYDQTAGSTLFYGASLAEVAPAYVNHTLCHASRLLRRYEKLNKKAEALAAVCEEKGDDAAFTEIQAMNLARAEAETAFRNVVKIIGGFAAFVPGESDYAAFHEGIRQLREIYRMNVRRAKINDRLHVITTKGDYYLARAKRLESPEEENLDHTRTAKVAQRFAEYAAQHEARRAVLTGKLEALDAQIKAAEEALVAFKAQFAEKPHFTEYDEMLDTGIDLSRLKYNEMRLLRRDLQIIFQDPYSSLNPRMTIGQIIEEGLVTHKFFRRGSHQMQEYILDVMRRCGLQDYMLHRYPHQFSGGQRQRISIARALAVKPQFIVCDECVSALDVSIQSQIINLLEELKETENLTYLFISHDLSVVRYISDRIGVMYLGNMVELGTAEEIFSDPRHPYTVALLSSIPTTDATRRLDPIILEGNIPSPIRPPDGCKFQTRCFMACDKCRRVPPPYVEVSEGHFVACHFLDRKIDENRSYLFDLPTAAEASATPAADTAVAPATSNA